jgi:quercetin dioxygenase-like cupin family protein
MELRSVVSQADGMSNLVALAAPSTRQVLRILMQYLSTSHHHQTAYRAVASSMTSGSEEPMHSHGDLEVIYVVEGALAVRSAGMQPNDWLSAEAGDVIFIPAEVTHAISNTTEKQVRTISLVRNSHSERPPESITPPALWEAGTPPSQNEILRFFLDATGHHYRSQSTTLSSTNDETATAVAVHKSIEQCTSARHHRKPDARGDLR